MIVEQEHAVTSNGPPQASWSIYPVSCLLDLQRKPKDHEVIGSNNAAWEGLFGLFNKLTYSPILFYICWYSVTNSLISLTEMC